MPLSTPTRAGQGQPTTSSQTLPSSSQPSTKRLQSLSGSSSSAPSNTLSRSMFSRRSILPVLLMMSKIIEALLPMISCSTLEPDFQ